MSNSNTDTKYNIPDGHWNDSSSEPAADDTDEDDNEDEGARVSLESQTVDVRHEEANRLVRYRVRVQHGRRDRFPLATHARREHQLAESGQWDLDGDVDWADVPVPVRQTVADVVSGVDSRADLDPGFRIFDDAEDGGRA